MTSEEFWCIQCNLKFINSLSLDIHNKYEHKEIFVNMWTQNEDISRGPQTVSPAGEINGPLSRITNCHIPNAYNENSVSSPQEATSPSSPLDYEYNMRENSNSIGIVSSGPNSGSSGGSYPQQSPGHCYPDYSINMQQPMYGNIHQQPFASLVCEEFPDQKRWHHPQRYRPYTMTRSPLPTPSPSASIKSEIKEEPNDSPPSTRDIFDLDSQKLLNTNQQTDEVAPETGLWREHQYQPINNQITGSVCSGVMGPMGMGAHPNMNGNSLNICNVPTSCFTPPICSPHNQQIQRPNYAQGSSVSTYYPQGMPVHSYNHFAQNPPIRMEIEGGPPPSEYPSNVKRQKNFKCRECNKWFTSHGHLKRHYNTTVHKNILKNGPSNTRVASPSTRNISHQKASSPSVNTMESVQIKAEPLTDPSPEPVDGNTFEQLPPVYQHQTLPDSFGIPPCNQMQPMYNPTAGHVNNTPSFVHNYTNEHVSPPHAMYQAHFGTDTSFQGYPHAINPRHFFNMHPNYGFSTMIAPNNSVNEYSNQIPVDAFNSFRLDSVDKNMNNNIVQSLDTATPSPIAGGEAVSEDSLESNDSITPTPEPNKYRCDSCNKSFNRMCYLTQHRSTHHDGEKPYKCSTCGKRFTGESNFQEHTKKHAGEKPYKCEVCPKQFNHKTDLRRHMCLHTGEKPYNCSQCNKGFIRKDHMLKHMETHRKKQNNANNNTNSNHSSLPRTATVVPMQSPAGVGGRQVLPNQVSPIANHMSNPMTNHIASGIPNNVSPGLPNHSIVGLPQHSPISLPNQFLAPYPPLSLTNHNTPVY